MSKFIISGGGTGGHIYPAIAIAQAIRRKEPEAGILFIGALGRMEMELVPAAGFRIEGLPVAGFIRRFTLKNLSFPVKLIRSLRRARILIREFNPRVVIGVGGYASGPTLRVAASMSIPLIIQEQNSFPGITNRLMGKKASVICVAYEGMDRYFPDEKIVLTGNPVRPGLNSLHHHSREAYSHFGLDSSKSTILVTGGSGGALTINESMLSLMRKGLPEGVQLLWQTGKYYYGEMMRQVTDPGFRILPFIDRMDLAYAAADLVISRAGAITISELCVAGKPAILVPSPNVAGDHQMKNARSLAIREAAVLVADREAVDRLPEMAAEIIRDEVILKTLAEKISALAITDGADRIAGEAFKLAGSKMEQDG